MPVWVQLCKCVRACAHVYMYLVIRRRLCCQASSALDTLSFKSIMYVCAIVFGGIIKQPDILVESASSVNDFCCVVTH
jgi:hypothetical protein